MLYSRCVCICVFVCVCLYTDTSIFSLSFSLSPTLRSLPPCFYFCSYATYSLHMLYFIQSIKAKTTQLHTCIRQRTNTYIYGIHVTTITASRVECSRSNNKSYERNYRKKDNKNAVLGLCGCVWCMCVMHGT